MILFRRAAAAAASALLVLGVAAEAVAQTRAPVIRPSDRQRAAQQHPQVLQAFGGAYQGPQAAYVARVGERVAAAAGLPGQCTFTLINSDVVNAFAVPGCYIYVTRGLLSIANSEDELAFVLGHEVGHVAANHSAQRQSRSVLSGLGALAVGVLTGSGELAQLAAQGAQLYTLRFSRTQEFQSDDLGVRYMVRAGYDPRAGADMLQQLIRDDELRARTRGREGAGETTPEWARTHPLTGNRVGRVVEQARAAGPAAAAEQEAPYYAAVSGLLYGDDPEQGFVDGRRFAHPVLRIAFEAPEGYALTNSPSAVMVDGPGGKAQFSGGRMQGSLEDHAAGVLRQLLGRTPAEVGRIRRTSTNGLDTVVLPARAQSQGRTVDVTVVAYRFGPETAYHFVALAPAGRTGAFDPLFGSVRRLNDAEAARLRPRVVEVESVRPGETARSLASRMAFEDYPLERFLALNGLAGDGPLQAGRRVKVVRYGR